MRISDWSSDVCSSDLWTGGQYGAGSRMPIKVTRALLNAALDGSLNGAEFRTDPNFGFKVPVAVAGVDSKILDPRETWADKAAYSSTAQKMVQLFIDNLPPFAGHVDQSEERRVGTEGGRTCKFWWLPSHYK